MAEILAQKGAHVTICARTQSKLESALSRVQARASNPSQQQLSYVVADVSTFDGAKTAVAACKAQAPDAVFCCAGGAKPGFFLTQSEADFAQGIRTDYMTTLSTAHSAANAMARAGVRGKIVLVSSTLGFMGLVGYAQYTPMKHAVRGLAESLRSELLLYGIDVHAYFPATILSPGFEVENETKPKITRDIEGVDEGLTPSQCAQGLLKGVQSGRFFITTDFNTDLFRAASAGGVPGNGILDKLYAVIAWVSCSIGSPSFSITTLVDLGTNHVLLLSQIGLPIWRRWVADSAIIAHREEHYKHLGLTLPSK